MDATSHEKGEVANDGQIMSVGLRNSVLGSFVYRQDSRCSWPVRKHGLPSWRTPWWFLCRTCISLSRSFVPRLALNVDTLRAQGRWSSLPVLYLRAGLAHYLELPNAFRPPRTREEASHGNSYQGRGPLAGKCPQGLVRYWKARGEVGPT